VLYAYLREALDAARGTRVCRQELWPANPAFGWQTGLVQVAASQPVGTPAARAAALARWRAVPRYIDTEITNLREGAGSGYTSAASAVRAVVEQLDGMLALPVDSLPFLEPASRDTTAEFRTALRTIVADSILPAARRYREFLATEYLPRARTSPAVAANRDGLACYRALLRAATSVDRDPKALFAEMSAQVQSDSVGMLRAGVAVYGKGPARDTKWLRAQIEADSAALLPTPEAIREFSERSVRRARAALPKWFSVVPSAEVVLTPFPAYQQATAPGGQYNPPAEDGSRPGIYYYRTYPPVTRIGLQATVFHETWPGHHLQAATVGERKASHPITRILWFPGFGEGWATYTEKLAYEMGLYETARDTLGYFADALRPLMVADLGMQVMGWTADQALAYMVAHTPTRTPDRLARAVTLITAIPGYVASYTVGALEIDRLRTEARRRLGRRFDIREFHRQLLEDGAVPLTFARQKIEHWAGAPRATP
jgi:uncharacterized protein (DUF885 family)